MKEVELNSLKENYKDIIQIRLIKNNKLKTNKYFENIINKVSDDFICIDKTYYLFYENNISKKTIKQYLFSKAPKNLEIKIREEEYNPFESIQERILSMKDI